jgi:GDP-D-mannose 3',5'-epimerase
VEVGFIGHHLAKLLKRKGYYVRIIDIKEPEFSDKYEAADEFYVADMRDYKTATKMCQGMNEVYALAANMGGIGFITEHTYDVLRDNVLINVNTAEACKEHGVERVFFSSSACVYPTHLQEDANVKPLKEEDAYPADPDNEYGWEKLFSERLYLSYSDFYEVRIARFHNIYGEEGTYDGGREKSPAAICRKVALADKEIEVWGDGLQTRSYCHVDDCIRGFYELMHSDIKEPLNIGSDRLVAINELVDVVSKIAGKDLTKVYDLTKPQGVRGRNSNNDKCEKELGFKTEITLEEGLRRTYQWIKDQLSV